MPTVNDDLEREYSPSSRVGGSAAPFVADYGRRSAAAVAALGDRVITLGDGTRVVAGDAGAPVLVFVHGGYWQALSAAESMYLAPAALAAGWSYAAVEYTIAPVGSLEQMVAQCSEAIPAVVAALGTALGGPVGPVVVAGHSAGAHLAAMTTLVADPAVDVRRTVLISGVFDLRPLLATTVNDPLDLDLARATALSPMLRPPPPGRRRDVVVMWGDNDTRAFIDQSRAYAAVLRDHGHAVAELEVAGRHHFDVVDEIVQPGSAANRRVADGLC